MNNSHLESKTIYKLLISVIIPVYNVEKYLDRAVQSVIQQSYTNLEIILVDDGSNDGSSDRCDYYAMIDHRVRVIHKANGGLSSARNAGLEISTGEFIAFLDSDDWLELDTFEYCISLMDKEHVDIVQYQTILTDGTPKKKLFKEKITLLKGKEILNHLMVQSTKSDRYYAAWNCIYRREIINGYKFPIGKINEDIVWKYRVLNNANSMIDSTAIKHFYFSNDGSITKAGLKKRDFDLVDAGKEIKELSSQETYGKIKKLGNVKCARSSLSLLCKIAYYGISDDSIDKKSIIKDLRMDLKQHYFLLIFSPMAISRKVLATMFCINYHITEFVVHCAKKTRKRG